MQLIKTFEGKWCECEWWLEKWKCRVAVIKMSESKIGWWKLLQRFVFQDFTLQQGCHLAHHCFVHLFDGMCRINSSPIILVKKLLHLGVHRLLEITEYMCLGLFHIFCKFNLLSITSWPNPPRMATFSGWASKKRIRSGRRRPTSGWQTHRRSRPFARE